MSSKESFQLKLQDATVDVERLGELFLMNREQVSVVAARRGAAAAAQHRSKQARTAELNLPSSCTPIWTTAAIVGWSAAVVLVLSAADQMISTDKQRNSNREALTALRKRHGEAKVWIYQSSNSFERCSTQGAMARLESGGCSSRAPAAAPAACVVASAAAPECQQVRPAAF